jgi:hypothetical protein
MKIRSLAIAASLLVSGSAQAAPILVAGWDFSQYIPGFLSTDGGNSLTNTLSSNYSDLDSNDAALGTTAVGNAGLGSGATQWGTLHLDGLYGSYNTPLDGADPIAPVPSTITLNSIVGQIAPPMGSAAAFSQLTLEVPQSQGSADQVGLAAGTNPGGPGLLDAVFETSLGSSFLGSGFELSFAGVTGTGTSNLVVEFSTDGANYSLLGNAALGTTAQVFSFAAGGTNLAEAFFRFRFTGSNSIASRIDNVAVKANVSVIPEPGTAFLLVAGLSGLAAFGRRRA